MNKLYATAVIAVMSLAAASAQRMMTYDVKVSNGTYQELADGTAITVEDTGEDFNNIVIDGSGTGNYDEFTGTGYPIGFDFEYNGKKVNQFMVGTNGYILLGKDQVKASCTTNPFLIFDNGKDSNLIGIIPISEVRAIPETRLSYKVEGTAPDRSLVVQYKNLVITDRHAYDIADTVQLQFRFYEKTGNLSVTCNGFQPWAGANMSYMSLKFGILGDMGDRLLLKDFKSGATTTQDQLISWSLTDYPADGVTYTFVAPEPCVKPASQPKGLTLKSATKRISGSFTKTGDADHYLVLATKDASLTETPANGTYYSAETALGNATVIAATDGNTFSSGDLFEAATAYNVFVIAYNARCNNGPIYNTDSPLTATVKTMATSPEDLTITATDANEADVAVKALEGYDVIVAYTDEIDTLHSGVILRNTGTFGTPNATYGVGDKIDGGGTVAYIGKSGSFKVSSLEPGKMYYFRAWSTDGNGSYSSEYLEKGAFTAAYLPWDANISKMAINNEPAGWASQGSFTKKREGYLQGEMKDVDAENGDKQWLETPEIYLADTQTRLFADITMEKPGSWYNDPFTFGEGDTLRVQVTTDGVNYKDIAVYDKGNDPGFSGVDDFNKFEWTFADYAGKKARLRFYLNVRHDALFYISSASATQKPECDYPKDVKVEKNEGKDITIAWTPQGEETAWEVEYKKTDDEEWSEPAKVSGSATYKLTDLESCTSYDVRVRALCSETTTSNWTGGTFTTETFIPFTLDPSKLTEAPAGWSSYSGKLADPTVMESGYDFSFYNYGGGELSFSSYDDSCDSWYVSPLLDLGTGNEYTFNLAIKTGYRSSYGTPSTDNAIKIVAASDGENFYSKDVLKTISYSDYDKESTDYSFDVPVKGYNGNIRLGIYVSSTTGEALSFNIKSMSVKKDSPTGINRDTLSDNADGNKPAAIYNAAGQRTDRMQKGINILRYGDGKTRKVIVR